MKEKYKEVKLTGSSTSNPFWVHEDEKNTLEIVELKKKFYKKFKYMYIIPVYFGLLIDYKHKKKHKIDNVFIDDVFDFFLPYIQKG
jgi:hypothetical protein